MFADHLRHAIERAPRSSYPHLSSALWKALAANQLTEAEASALSDALEARKALPPPQEPVQRRVGSRPRSPASMERRRSCASSGFLPPHLAARFTLGEQAALAVIARQSVRHSACQLALDHVAALAGVSRSTVKRAIREAEVLGLLRVEERRLTAWRNLPHRITVTSQEWSAWLRHRRRGVEFNSGPPRISARQKGAPDGAKGHREGGFQPRWRDRSVGERQDERS
jgi:hypothetical protein